MVCAVAGFPEGIEGRSYAAQHGPWCVPQAALLAPDSTSATGCVSTRGGSEHSSFTTLDVLIPYCPTDNNLSLKLSAADLEHAVWAIHLLSAPLDQPCVNT